MASLRSSPPRAVRVPKEVGPIIELGAAGMELRRVPNTITKHPNLTSPRLVVSVSKKLFAVRLGVESRRSGVPAPGQQIKSVGLRLPSAEPAYWGHVGPRRMR
ncbi:hypothetical protein CCHR01_18426 [Colletotrichum chrysophilum]|uniref:Uncharacterized protein n=1 Tax=Colletotrichum chrysophilum TaxID=1836956 RepID=A0AAD9E8Y0_9PEZI|nr:hypothetical protein CCHR01_18426 [Colletotrichum chrysophilum]